MRERRMNLRTVPNFAQRVLILHGAKGPICARAEDESSSGLGLSVQHLDGVELGQRILIHRLHQSGLIMGTVRHVAGDGTIGFRLGIQLAHPMQTYTDPFPLKALL